MMTVTLIRSLAAPALALCLGSASAQTADDPRRILADLLMNDAIGLVSAAQTIPAELELGVRLALESASLAVDDVDLWRAVVQLADVADAPQVAERALTEVTRLDPTDQSAALRRLTVALDRLPTIEQRVEAVTNLLREDRLPPVMASRVAFDLALLLQRAGDLDGYLQWLSEAVALDPANAMAVSDLAGYLAGSTADPTLQAELLMARCLANPAYTPAIDGLANFLARQGADRTALRLRLLLLSLRGSATQARPDDLMNAVVAAWAVGDEQQALDLIQRRRDRENELLRTALGWVRQTVEAMRPAEELIETISGSLSRAAAVHFRSIVAEAAPDPPSDEAVLRAVSPASLLIASGPAAILHPDLRADGVAPEGYLDAATFLMHSLHHDLLQREGQPVPPEEAAIIVFLALWLLDDSPLADASVSLVIGPIVAEHRETLPRWARGWIALRADRLDDAVALLEPIADGMPLAGLGLAMALLELDRKRDAATRLLQVARAVPTGVAGVWARKRLEALLGASAPLTPNAAAVEAVAATLPTTFDRMLLHPGRHLSIAVRTPTQDFSLFERVEVYLEVTNRSDLPLAISAAGPILSSVAIPMGITSFGTQSAARDLPMPIFVDIGQRLQIEPWQTLTVKANLSRGVIGTQTTLGEALADLTPIGAHAVLRGRAMLNPAPSPYGGQRGLVEPSLLGSESAPMALRSMGIEQDRNWFDRTVAQLSDPAQPPNPLPTATMMAWIARFNVDAAMELVSPDDRVSMERDYSDRVRAIELAFPRLDPLWQAVTAKMLLGGRSRLDGITWMARNSPDRWVRLATLLSIVTAPEDPYIDELRRGDDAALRRIAELYGESLRRRSADR